MAEVLDDVRAAGGIEGDVGEYFSGPLDDSM